MAIFCRGTGPFQSGWAFADGVDLEGLAFLATASTGPADLLARILDNCRGVPYV